MNQVALITGGGKGIGQAITLALAQSGIDVAINYYGSHELAQETKQKALEYGVKAEIYRCNLSQFDEVNEMIKKVHQDFSRIDILINNSGINKDGLLMRMDEDQFDDVISVNLKGTFNTTRFITPIMMRQKSGVIINISSVIGVIGNAGQANYAASKAGIIGLTKSVAKELASRNIRCNAIAPGFIETEMTKSMDETISNKITSSIPLKRLGQAEDIANLVTFLCSEKASYITGQTIVIDGGLSIGGLG